MPQKYKVYYNSRVIIITDKLESLSSTAIQRVCHYPEAKLADEWRRFKADTEVPTLYIIGNPDETWKEFRKNFLVIKAAGGLVKNEKGEYLFIYRNGKWDLPKGKIEPGEKPRQAALREVEEECGVKKLEIVKPIGKSYHIYELKGKQAMKKTYWFDMLCKEDSVPTPQKEEGIEKAVWAKPTEFKQWKKEMYPSVWNIVRKVE